MEFRLEPANRNVTDEELLDDLRSVVLLAGKSLTREEYDAAGKFNSATLRKRFGGWNKALKKAGLEPSTNHGASEEELFENLQNIWITLGRQPRSNEMRRPLSNYRSDIYQERYGTWMKALERFVEVVNGSANDTETEVAPMPTQPSEYKHQTKREVNWRLRFRVFARDNYRCVACGRSPAKDPTIELHADHVLAWSRGGETVIENLQTLCNVCNLGKSNIEV
jgi:predicted restriction endonuclease